MEDPEAKRRKEEELIYNTLKEFFILELVPAIPSRIPRRPFLMGKMMVGDAITDHHCEPEFE